MASKRRCPPVPPSADVWWSIASRLRLPNGLPVRASRPSCSRAPCTWASSARRNSLRRRMMSMREDLAKCCNAVRAMANNPREAPRNHRWRMPMNRALHPEIVVTETPEGVHYCLPKRDSPLMQMGARALLAMAIVVWSVPFINAWFMGGPGGVRGNFVAAISVVTLVPIALFSGALLVASLFFLGHSEVTLTSDDLVVRERARLFGISRRRRASQVRRLTVRIPYPVKQTSATGESMFANDGPATLSCIEIDMADGKRICAGIGYSTPLLVSLAEELRSRLQTLSSKFEAPLAL